MKLYYLTLNTDEEARKIGHILLEKKLAVCVNWFPITCAYRFSDEITEEPEIVLIIKTQTGYRLQIECILREQISYSNFVAEITPTAVNQDFLNWLDAVVPIRPLENTLPG